MNLTNTGGTDSGVLRSGLTRRRAIGAAAALAGSALLPAACGKSGGSSKAASTATRGVTITVALASDPPAQKALDAFQKQSGITVKWSTIDWDSLQTKITAATTAHTYFADATDVDWSRVGQLQKLGAFFPMEDQLDTSSLKDEMPQLASFTAEGHVVGIPYDASFLVATVNTKMFAAAGITTMPTTIDDYTAALRKIQAKGIVEHPLDIPFAAAEGLSTYWYQTTGAFGGKILDGSGKPQFADPGSPGYKAAEWMVQAFKDKLVPPGNVNVSDSQGQQNLMAKGQVASVFGDYSGTIGTLYNIPSASKVVKQIEYIPTPGANGVGPNLNNPDGIGIPRQAKYPAAAAKFIEWFTAAKTQTDFAGVNGPDKALSGYPLPSRLSVVDTMAKSGNLVGGKILSQLLKEHATPVFPDGAPSWYPEFSRSVYTNLHAAVAGSMTAAAAVGAIAATANRLSAQS